MLIQLCFGNQLLTKALQRSRDHINHALVSCHMISIGLYCIYSLSWISPVKRYLPSFSFNHTSETFWFAICDAELYWQYSIFTVRDLKKMWLYFGWLHNNSYLPSIYYTYDSVLTLPVFNCFIKSNVKQEIPLYIIHMSYPEWDEHWHMSTSLICSPKLCLKF